MQGIFDHFVKGFERAHASQAGAERRIGAELKFPLVDRDGQAVCLDVLRALWKYLAGRGWQPVVDTMTKEVIGARRRGERNDTVASSETGYCKTEFALAHVANLFDLEHAIIALRAELRPFAERHEVRFLGYGIHPVTPPSERLLMNKSRTSVWDKVFPSNRHIRPEDGDDVHLFTVNAASHVHVSVPRDEAIPLVNVLNGFAGAQIALTAHSNIWRGRIDPTYRCVAEKFWDWWMPDADRVGVPRVPFDHLEHYVDTIASFKPVYVKRNGQPILLSRYDSFGEYYCSGRPVGVTLDGEEIPLKPEPADIDLHSTCYWYNARLSRHYTVENRVNDQQPPDDLLAVAALTLGLAAALHEASEEISSYDWEHLRAAREAACRDGLSGCAGPFLLSETATQMLLIARLGLRRRGLGEERFLAPLEARLAARTCPADEAAMIFKTRGLQALLDDRTL